MRTLLTSPGLEDWQLHFALLGGQEHTVPGLFIANDVDEPLKAMPIVPPVQADRGGLPSAADGQAYWLHASASEDGTFTVTNTRNGFSKTYR